MKRALVLCNLGTPNSPEPHDVKVYLKEFLMDKYVVDIPWILRWILVNILIVPRRQYKSSEAYHKIWQRDRGSPLLFHLEDLAKEVKKHLPSDLRVYTAMRYAQPSLQQLATKLKEEGVQEAIFLPLYPQFADSSFTTLTKQWEKIALEQHLDCRSRFIEPFYNQPSFINALWRKTDEGLKKNSWDHLLMSYHGLPERHIQRLDLSGQHCLKKENCCDNITETNKYCYRAQCYSTSRALAAKLGLQTNQWSVSFQSRLGRTPWIQPFTDEVLPKLVAQGIKRLAVVCPSFTADCLETLEEIQIRAREDFIKAGGEDLFLIPCLNSDPVWAKAVIDIASL